MTDSDIDKFLSGYTAEVVGTVTRLRKTVTGALPRISEELDLPARMISYSYGRTYAESICVIIPSKKGVKLGFYKGVDLPDPDNLLRGDGKLSRYVEIQAGTPLPLSGIKKLIKAARQAYKLRMKRAEKG